MIKDGNCLYFWVVIIFEVHDFSLFCFENFLNKFTGLFSSLIFSKVSDDGKHRVQNLTRIISFAL